MLKCDFCNAETTSLKEKKESETREPALACDDCWEYAEVYWKYIDQKRFPAHKGIKCGDKVWCRIRYENDDDEWVKGIVNSVMIVNAGEEIMFIYYCFVEDDEHKEGVYYSFWEEDMWFRNPDDEDSLNVEPDNDIESHDLDERLLTRFYEDSL